MVYSAYQKKKVIHFQRPIVLMSINLNICMWHINKEQLILFPLVPFLHQVCHAWPSTLPLKVTMSFSTFCRFYEFDKIVIAKQCNGVDSEIVTFHARWSFPFWKFEYQGACDFSLWSWESFGRIYMRWINGCLGNYLAMVRQHIQDMLHCCQLCVEIRGGYVEDVGA